MIKYTRLAEKSVSRCVIIALLTVQKSKNAEKIETDEVRKLGIENISDKFFIYEHAKM